MAEKIKTKAQIAREENMSYKNFNVAVYCPVNNINHITDFEAFDEKLRLLLDHVKIGRVYLECYRGMEWCDKEQLLKVKKFFEDKGIATSGGITTNDDSDNEGYISLCYSTEKGLDILKKTVALNAEVFDEFIFDDFYFLNCRCNTCIKQKGHRSWSQFRMDQKRYITEEIVMKTAKEINPDVNVIVKYPQWYEVYNETGYDLRLEPEIADCIYTGTETRNPTYAQQHLPKYLSYFIMRYLEKAAPGRNLGGWFDVYECTYNLTSYLEQGYLTLFGKAKEATLFCLSELIESSQYQTFAPAVGQMFKEVDAYLDQLGNPVGAAAYRPSNARGEDNLHNYLGMCGIPLEAEIDYPENADVVFLTEGAAYDSEIVAKMQDSMMRGADVIVTSGFVRKLGDAFKEFVNVEYSARKAFVFEYADSKDHGLSVSGKYTGDAKIIIPQLDCCTNDMWELAAAYGTDNNFPIVLRCSYGLGRLSIITIPDNMGDLYHYPTKVLNVIRRLFTEKLNLPALDCPAKVQMFAYDNHTGILRSDLEYNETISVEFPKEVNKVIDIISKRELPLLNHMVTVPVMPGVNYVFQYE